MVECSIVSTAQSSLSLQQ
jgi:hypothetical protein